MFSFSGRSAFVAILMVFVACLMVIKLFFIQIIDEKYKLSAESNSRRNDIQYPSRGLIFDRNGKLLVSNQAVYDLMIVPRDVHNFDSLDFCNAVGIDMPTLNKLFGNLRQNIRKRKASTYKPSVFISSCRRAYAVLQEKLHNSAAFTNERTHENTNIRSSTYTWFMLRR